MKLYIIRHGQTDWNVLRRLQGRTDISLNENGRSSARATAEGMKDIHFDGVISSPLSRAMETAQIVLGLARKPGPVKSMSPGVQDMSSQFGMPFLTDDRIQEMSFGVYEGLSGLNPDYALHDPDFHYFSDRPEIFRAPAEGENCWDLVRRTGDFLTSLLEQAALEHEAGIEHTYLVSVHGAVTRAMLTNIEHTPVADFWKNGVPKNCAVSIVESCGEPWRLLEKDILFYEDI